LEKIDPSRIAARPGEAGDKTKLDRIIRNGKDDRNRLGRSFGRERRRRTGCGDHGDPSANQVGCQLRQPIELTLRPAVFDRHVLALDMAGFFKALVKCAQAVRVRVR
jgi:hypothetical protein